MSSLTSLFNYAVGRKIVMALTGLFLCIFLLEHLYTNLLLYISDKEFIEASHTMVHNLLIRAVEMFLFAAILIHIYQALNLTIKNSSARPVKYTVPQSSENSSWFSRNMGFTGSIILFFIVIHLYNFFLPYRILHSIGGIGQDTVAAEVKEAFQNPYYAGLYFVAVLFLGFHLSHAFQSAFQTLGLNNKQYAPVIKLIGTLFALLITVGFASFPIIYYFHLFGK